jgi:hypothetical protein
MESNLSKMMNFSLHEVKVYLIFKMFSRIRTRNLCERSEKTENTCAKFKQNLIIQNY